MKLLMNKSNLFQNLIPLVFLILGLSTAISLNNLSTQVQPKPSTFQFSWDLTTALVDNLSF